MDRAYLERSLAIVLGYGPDDAVKISSSERTAPDLPASEQAAVELALGNSKELRRLESVLTARGYTVKAQRASWLPQVDLVAQYALLTRQYFNEDFFGRFNRHAGQIGVSIQIPILNGTGASALAPAGGNRFDPAARGDQERARADFTGCPAQLRGAAERGSGRRGGSPRS